MKRKNVAMTIATILCALGFIIIGSCFSAFIYSKEMVEVENPKLVLAGGISVFSKDGEIINELNLSKLKLGLKPSTGEEDVETSIPTTVTDKQGSEGQYSKFKLYAPKGVSIYISDINIESEHSEEEIKGERENIMVAIEEIKDSAVSLKEDRVLLGTLEATEEQKEYTFFIWLNGKAGECLEASKISFKINFEALK